MSNAYYTGGMTGGLGQGSASISDVVTKLDGVVRNLASNGTTLTSILTTLQTAIPTATGTFTLSAAASTIVNQPLAQANSYIPTPTATNATAATLMGSAKYLYISSINPGVSFTVTTGSGGAAAGTETFKYAVFQPLG
jgi:hypothetical protein